jgi:ElaB/YqjD/DUF883 family membrane-anchored ribosome-binding protein
MTQVGDTLDQFARAVRDAGEGIRTDQPQIAGFADTAAGQVERASEYLREHDAREVMDAAQEFARRQPAVVIGAGLALGMLVGRALKSAGQSGASRYRSDRRFADYGQSGGYGGYGGYGGSGGTAYSPATGSRMGTGSSTATGYRTGTGSGTGTGSVGGVAAGSAATTTDYVGTTSRYDAASTELTDLDDVEVGGSTLDREMER